MFVLQHHVPRANSTNTFVALTYRIDNDFDIFDETTESLIKLGRGCKAVNRDTFTHHVLPGPFHSELLLS